MTDQIINRDAPTAQSLGPASTPLDTAEYPTPMGDVGPRSNLPWMRAFLAALDGPCASQPDPFTCAMNEANKAVGQPSEEDYAMAQQSPTVERTFVPLHRNDLGDYPLPFVIRKDFSPEKRAEMAKKGHALPDGSYPIGDKEDLSNAISAFGRAPEGKRNQVAAHIRKRAKALGATGDVSEQWGGTADTKKSLVAEAKGFAKSKGGDASGQHVKQQWGQGDIYAQPQEGEVQGEEVFDQAQRDANIADAEEPDPSGRYKGDAAGDDIKDNRNRATDPAANRLIPAAPGPAGQKQVYDGRQQAHNPEPKDMQTPVDADPSVGALGTGKNDQEQELQRMEESRKRNTKKTNKLAGAGPAVGPTGAMGMAAMTDRSILRRMEADEDARALASPDADKLIQRPSHVDSNDWMSRPLAMRTLRAQIIERTVDRSYEEAVERTVAEGWQAIANPTRPVEKIFQRSVQTLDGLLLTRSVLVRTAGSYPPDWHLRELTRGASSTLAAQVAMNERRYGDSRPFDLAASRFQADAATLAPIVTRSALSSAELRTFSVREAARLQFGVPLSPIVTRDGSDIGGEGTPSEGVEAGARSGAEEDWTSVFDELKDWWSGLTEISDDTKRWAEAYARWWVAGAKGESPMPHSFGAADEWVGQKHNIENYLAERKPSTIHPLTKRGDIGGEGDTSQAVEGEARATTPGAPAGRLGDKFLNHARIHYEQAKATTGVAAKYSEAVISAARDILGKFDMGGKVSIDDLNLHVAGKMDDDISHYTPQGHYVTYGMVRDALNVLPAHQQAINQYAEAGAGSIENAVPSLAAGSDDPNRPGPQAARGPDMDKPNREHSADLTSVQGFGANDTRFKGGVIRDDAEVERRKALTSQEQSQLKRAKDRMAMDDSKTRMIGGMSREEAQAIMDKMGGGGDDEGAADDTKGDEKKGNPY